MPDWRERKALREAWERDISASGLAAMVPPWHLAGLQYGTIAASPLAEGYYSGSTRIS